MVGELTAAIKGGLRKSAKKVLEHTDDLKKTAKNAEEAKQIDEVIEHLYKVAEETTDYSSRFAKKVLKNLDEVSSKIKNYESSIQKLKYEEGMLLNNAKKIEIKKVTQKKESSINWGHISDEKFVKSIITHNHPNGSGLSLADIKMFIGTRLSEVRAVTPEGTVYSIKNKGITDRLGKELIDKIEKQEKFAKATFPNAEEFLDAYVFRVIWEDIKDLVEYIHYVK